MFRFIWRQLRGRAGRSVALLVGVLVATSGFVVLTGATTASRLAVTGTVERNTRAAYDILVRPQGARTPLEAERGLVRPNYLSGSYGGITPAQVDQVEAVAGVDVAAPIAMVGYSTTLIDMPVDLTDAIDRTLERQVIRIDRTFLAERGLSHAPAQPFYVYVTTHQLLYPTFGDSFRPDAVRYTDGRTYDVQECGLVPREVLPDGRNAEVCDPAAAQDPSLYTLTERQTWRVQTFRLLPDGRFERSTADGEAGRPQVTTEDRLVLHLNLNVPFLLAAVDPEAEQRLVGLSDAVVDGRPLAESDRATDNRYQGGLRSRTLPVLTTSRPFLDGTLRAGYTRIAPIRSIAGIRPENLAGALRGAPALPAGGSTQDAVSAYRKQLATGLDGGTCCFGELQRILQPGETGYDEHPDGTLRARKATIDASVYTDAELATRLARPWLTEDTSFRPLSVVKMPPSHKDARQWRAVGVFDPQKLAGFSDLGRVPLETYEPPQAEGADDRSRAALGGRPLEPNGDPAGYLSAPPLLLTNLASAQTLLTGTGRQSTAPISAIRVRVADVSGFSERSAERVRLIAEQINRVTGLDVDITLGSSPAPQTVELPAGSFGRPDLGLTESWSALGVASTITTAVDRKSVALFLLVLVVCALFLGNAVSAAVRDRRSELAVLTCLGWPARRIAALILGEVAVLGLAAGLLAVGLAFPLGGALGIGVDWRRALLAVPVAVLLALVAGLAPALRAAHAHPAAALRPAGGGGPLGTPTTHPARSGAGQPGPHAGAHSARRGRSSDRGGGADAGDRRRVRLPRRDRRQPAR
ncbi:FtsX-like permease family protein [Micromonospora zamorensis]|uniref:FtsX-like permease family protein n=1 Tax=Micromonospora zamorensis TaxID=709883 RepID=UPI003D938B74